MRAKVRSYRSSHPGQENCTNETRDRTYVFKKKRNKEKSAFTFMRLIQYSDKLNQNYRGKRVLNFSKDFPRMKTKWLK